MMQVFLIGENMHLIYFAFNKSVGIFHLLSPTARVINTVIFLYYQVKLTNTEYNTNKIIH